MSSRKLSEKVILSHLVMRNQASLLELARTAGMPASTVVGILSRLAEQGLVCRSGNLAGTRGRPVALYKLQLPRPVAAYHFDGTQLLGAVIDTDLNVRALEGVDVGPIETVDAASDLIEDALSRLETASGISRNKLSGLALAINAIDTGHRTLVSSVLPWVNREIELVISEKVCLPVRQVDFPGAVAEYQQFTRQPPESLIMFNVGDGVSTHMILFGQPFRGHSSLAGELGHIVMDPNGPLCGCGQNGCLEAYCSGPAIYRQITDGLNSGVVSCLNRETLAALPPRLAVEQIWEAWRDGDNYVRSVMDGVLERLGWGLGMVSTLIDPEYVAISGYILKDRREWMERVIQRSQRWIFQSGSRNMKICAGKASAIDELRVIGSRFYYDTEGGNVSAEHTESVAINQTKD